MMNSTQSRVTSHSPSHSPSHSLSSTPDSTPLTSTQIHTPTLSPTLTPTLTPYPRPELGVPLEFLFQELVAKSTKQNVSRCLASASSLLNSTQKKYVETLSTLVATTGVVISGSSVEANTITDRIAAQFDFGLAYGVDKRVIEIDWQNVEADVFSVKLEPIDSDADSDESPTSKRVKTE